MIALLLGCAPDLAAIHVWDDGAPDTGDTGQTGPRVVTRPVPDGLETRVDARDGVGWLRLDLDGGGVEVAGDDPAWDLAFQRFDIATNSGVSGPGAVAAVFYPEQALAEVVDVPSDGWLVDAPDGDDLNDKPDWALTGWFLYDGETHVVSVNPGVWLIRSTEGAVYALRFDSYYDETGVSAQIRFTWAPRSPAP